MNLDKLRGALAEKRITQVELAKKLRLTPKTVNAKLNGHSPITVEEAALIVQYVKIDNPDEIFFNKSLQKRFILLKLEA